MDCGRSDPAANVHSEAEKTKKSKASGKHVILPRARQEALSYCNTVLVSSENKNMVFCRVLEISFKIVDTVTALFWSGQTYQLPRAVTGASELTLA